MGHKVLCVAAALCLFAHSANAQLKTFDVEEVYNTYRVGSSALLGDVISAIKSTPLVANFDVKGVVDFKNNILRTNRLSIFDGGVLLLSNIDADYVAIVAKELVIDVKPGGQYGTISRPVGGTFENYTMLKLRGKDGSPGPNGPNGNGTHSRTGNDGANGSDGVTGDDGSKQHLPDVYLFVQNITLGADTPPNTEIVSLFFDGIAGGNGGRGGIGGVGGRGANGDPGSDGLFDCRESGGNGGHGGQGGRGGHGGRAADGGNGANVFFYSPLPDVLKYFSVRQEPAATGAGGPPGISGMAGRGGDGGGGTVHCGGGHGGGNGGTPAPLPAGDLGNLGSRGLKKNEIRNNNDLF